MESESSKPYLRKGGGVTGKYMKLVNYPLLRKNGKDRSLNARDPHFDKSDDQAVNGNLISSEANSMNLESFSSGIEAQAISSLSSKKPDDVEIRPVTAETADSGYPEDEVVILSDKSTTTSQPTVSCDVSDISNQQVLDDDVKLPIEYEESGSFQSVEPDIVSSVASASYGLKKTVFDSTAEFELVEAEINACNRNNITPLNCSRNSSLKDVEIRIGQQRNTAFAGKDCNSEYSVLSVPILLNNGSEKVSDKKLLLAKKADSFNSLDRASCRERLRRLLDTNIAEEELRRPLRHAFPESLGKQVNSLENDENDKPSLYSDQSPHDGNAESCPVDRLGESGRRFCQVTTNADFVDTSNDLTAQQRALAKQLRDLIMCLDIAFEKNIEINEVCSKLVEHYALILEERDGLLLSLRKLQDEDRVQVEQCASLKKSEQLKMSEIKRLKRELAALRREQKERQNEENEVVKLLKQQTKDLRNHGLELGRKLTDEKSQKRIIEIKLKEQDKINAQLKEENEKLMSRLRAISGQKAEIRGKNAEEVLSQNALKRAVGRAPVTAFSKRTASTAGCSGHKSTETELSVPSSSLDDECGIQLSNMYLSGSQQKTVHWNEPVATTANHFENSSAAFPNDMPAVKIEENNFGKSTFYRDSSGNFVVHTLTFCKCNFYEYRNGDTRWIDSMKKYQVYYYAGAGATTVESCSGDILIRHFLKGQLEVYRSSGEITLITSNGTRIETIKQPNASETSFRVEIFDDNKSFRVVYNNGEEMHKLNGFESCFRSDGSFAVFVECDNSIEFRGPTYAIRRFKNGDVKVRLAEIDTSISLLVADVGTVKHHIKPACCVHKYCVEWGKVAREKSRRSHINSHQSS